MEKNAVISAINIKDIFQNAKKGTSTVVSITDKYIYYMRGKSKIAMPLDAFCDACDYFKSKNCTTTDLKTYMPKIFSTKKGGHDCNCTFLFRVAEKMGLLDGGISGKGTRGNTFYVKFK